jgi:hypothetical protein
MTTINESSASVASPRAAARPRLPSIGISVAFSACVVLLTASLLVGALNRSASATLVAILDALAVASLSAGLFAWAKVARSGRLRDGALVPVAARERVQSQAPGEGERHLMALLELSCDWFWEMDESLRFTSVQRCRPDDPSLKDEEVLGDALSCDGEFAGERGRRRFAAVEQQVEQSEPHRIAERRPHAIGILAVLAVLRHRMCRGTVTRAA